jgi:hypothetical protein
MIIDYGMHTGRYSITLYVVSRRFDRRKIVVLSVSDQVVNVIGFPSRRTLTAIN